MVVAKQGEKKWARVMTERMDQLKLERGIKELELRQGQPFYSADCCAQQLQAGSLEPS